MGEVICIEAIRATQVFERVQTGSSWHAGKDSRVLSNRIALIVGKEEEFVVKDWSTDLSAVAIVVKARIDERLATLGPAFGVQVTVLKVFIHAAMEFISSEITWVLNWPPEEWPNSGEN